MVLLGLEAVEVECADGGKDFALEDLPDVVVRFRGQHEGVHAKPFGVAGAVEFLHWIHGDFRLGLGLGLWFLLRWCLFGFLLEDAFGEGFQVFHGSLEGALLGGCAAGEHGVEEGVDGCAGAEGFVVKEVVGEGVGCLLLDILVQFLEGFALGAGHCRFPRRFRLLDGWGEVCITFERNGVVCPSVGGHVTPRSAIRHGMPLLDRPGLIEEWCERLGCRDVGSDACAGQCPCRGLTYRH